VTTYNLKRGYECATAFGVSSTAAGLGFKKTGGKLVTMDAYVEELYDNCNSYRGVEAVTHPNSDDYKSAKFLHKHFGLEETVFCEVGWSPRDTAQTISKHFAPEEKLDFVFIDAGHFPEQVSGRYDLKATVQGLIKYYREQKETLAQMKKAIADEEHRKKKRENDIADGLVVSKLLVVADFRKVAEPIKQILRQKLENEYPLAVAGLDVPQARIYGKRLEDDVLAEFQKIFSKFET
jgi:hypothetical protein